MQLTSWSRVLKKTKSLS